MLGAQPHQKNRRQALSLKSAPWFLHRHPPKRETQQKTHWNENVFEDSFLRLSYRVQRKFQAFLRANLWPLWTTFDDVCLDGRDDDGSFGSRFRAFDRQSSRWLMR